MAKQLFPSRRGLGRSAQREKPGDAIRGVLMASPRGASIGDCHRKYTELKLKDWQKEQIAKIAGVGSSDPRILLEEKAIHVYPRSPSKQIAFVTRKMKTIDKIMARKRAPFSTTYEGFSRFFHYLLQLGYVEQETKKDFVTGKVTRVREAPKMHGADGDLIFDAYKARAAGRQARVQIEPPVIYKITDLGQSVQDWNNPRKEL